MSGGKKRKKSLGLFSTLLNFFAREESPTERPRTKEEWQTSMIERMGNLYKVGNAFDVQQYQRSIVCGISS